MSIIDSKVLEIIEKAMLGKGLPDEDITMLYLLRVHLDLSSSLRSLAVAAYMEKA